MDFTSFSIGIDIENIERFRGKSLESDMSFLSLIFTPKELEYCFSKSNSAQHLCGRFCAKEAVVKALTPLGIVDVLYNEIEILNTEKFYPIAKIEKYPNVDIKVSISHNKEYATANAIVVRLN